MEQGDFRVALFFRPAFLVRAGAQSRSAGVGFGLSY
jgi:hypothetical protein